MQAAPSLPMLQSAEAQAAFLGPDDHEVVFRARILERDVSSGTPLIEGVQRYIVVHLAENRVFLFDGDRAIWSAPLYGELGIASGGRP